MYTHIHMCMYACMYVSMPAAPVVTIHRVLVVDVEHDARAV